MKVALFEHGFSHTEILLSQISFLIDSRIEVHLIGRSSEIAKIYKIPSNINVYCSWEKKNMFFSILNVKKYLKKNQIKIIILNSAEGKLIQYFCMLSNKKIQKIGIIHNLHKIGESFTQNRILANVDKVFVLSRYMLKYFLTLKKNKPAEYFYSLVKPDIKKDKKIKPCNEFWIAVPGVIEYRRKDLLSVVSILPKIKKSPIKFVFLSNSNIQDGAEFKLVIEKNNFQDYCIFFNEFLTERLMYSYLSECCAILPLITPNIDEYEHFSSTKISGAFNLALQTKLPLLLHTALAHNIEYKSCSIYYDNYTFASKLFELIDSCQNPLPSEEKIIEESLTYEFQQKKFVNFILDNQFS